MVSFLEAHFITFMEAVEDGLFPVVRAEDLVFRLDPKEKGSAAATYCIVNDLDTDEWVPKLVAMYEDYRQRNPIKPVPSNVQLGEN
jgi:hypothetical protein